MHKLRAKQILGVNQKEMFCSHHVGVGPAFVSDPRHQTHCLLITGFSSLLLMALMACHLPLIQKHTPSLSSVTYFCRVFLPSPHLLLVVVVFLFAFVTGLHSVAQAVLELSLKLRMCLNSLSSCFSFLSFPVILRITDVSHRVHLEFII